MENNIIMVRGLGFDYGDGWVFHKLNLDIAEGDFAAQRETNPLAA